LTQVLSRSCIFLSFLLVCTVLWADHFEIPKLTGPVVDRAGMITRSARRKISQSLQQLKKQGGTQIAVLTLNDLAGISIEQASIQVVDQWKLGDEKSDNGILLLISKKDRKMRIEVGQGVEGDLTDAYSKRIIDETMVPLFRSGKVDEGVLLGVYQIAQRANPTMNLESVFGSGQRGWKRRTRSRRGIGSFLPFILLLFLFGSRLGRRRGMGGAGLFLSGMLLGGLGGRGYSGGGGFSGGGFGGGGGGFSGGGASGGW